MKKITDVNGKYKTIYRFHKNGHLRQLTSRHQWKKRVTKFEYESNDTTLTIFSITSNSVICEKYSYDSLDRCKNMFIYSQEDNFQVPFVKLNNFVYNLDGLLLEYTRDNWTYKFIYSDKGQIIKITQVVDAIDDGVSEIEFEYDENGYIIKELYTSNSMGFVGIDGNHFNRNKLIILYEDFDRHANWQNSYYLTEKGKVFRSMRRIEYW